jgi:hypothetical protein
VKTDERMKRSTLWIATISLPIFFYCEAIIAKNVFGFFVRSGSSSLPDRIYAYPAPETVRLQWIVVSIVSIVSAAALGATIHWRTRRSS